MIVSHFDMAHLLPCYPYVPKCVRTASSQRYTGTKSWSIASHRMSFKRKRSYLGCCCASFSTSSAKEVFLVDIDDKEKQFEYLVSENGWRVRRLFEETDEMRKVAYIQAEAFHTPVAFFDDLFFEFFKAEVLSGLIYKLRNSPPNRYVCLVAEPTIDASISQGKLVVGIVDVTVLRDEAVLQHLPSAEEYLYVSGLAVSKHYRRRKIASVLLKACDVLSVVWGFEYLVLRAHEDDLGARKLYSNAGYRVVSGDPHWMTSWIGRKRRLVMMKRSAS
ncbi:Acetyltransf_1 domain-containing protein [Cephalotus follicularis]|uniref:Acetyltransf_1 domain-containing protein n=1 Tax=Cephalotus follicularis TaxID=3775 RepID=A0A1Q3AXG5_CEPFO|nr:Acetyltransf_1 domain-containing protein [Cephalotus follicularis]